MYDDRTTDNLQNEMLTQVSTQYNKSVGSFVWDILKAIAIKLNEIYTNLISLSNKFDINTLTSTDLDNFITQRSGISRRTATKAIGTLTITGTGTININDVFETATGIQFVATETKAITASGTISIEAVNAGDSGNVDAETIIYMPITLTGITACTNNSETAGGYEQETDDELRERYLEYLAEPPTSGNAASYKAWAKSVSGVGDAKVIPLWDGVNTVKVLIIDSNNEPASETIVNNVQEYIDPNSEGLGNGVAPLGAYCTVESATAKSISVTVTVIKDTAYTDATVQNNVEQSITEYLQSIAFVRTYVSYGNIGVAIFNADGVIDYASLEVNSGTSNITLLENEVAVLDSVVITYD